MIKKALIGLLLVAVVSSPVLAATTMTGMSAINEDADAAHNPYIDGDVTKSTHEMGWGPMEYEADDGDLTTHVGELNDTADNPYSFTYSDIETSAYGEFPVNTQTEDVDSALNASGWATDAGGTAGSVSVSDSTTAPNVEAVNIAATSQTSGDTAKASFDGYKISSDAQKRYVSLVVDVNTLDAGADVFVRFMDTDGDYVEAEIDPDDNYDTGNTVANSTGEGYVFQRQVGELTVAGTGDGTMGNINETVVVVNDANADIDIAALNVEKTSPWTLGDRMADTDGDGDLETETLTEINTSGDVSLKSLESMGSIYDAATIHDLTVPFKAYSSDMEPPTSEEDFDVWNVTYRDAEDYPSFDKRVDDSRRLTVPTAYDLSYANLKLQDSVAVPSNRYSTVEYATNVGTTNFSNVTYTAATSSYDAKGDDVTLATGLSAGEYAVVHYDNYTVTQSEFEALTATSGGGAPMDDGSGSGIFSLPVVGGVLAAIAAFLGLRGGN